MCFETKYKPYSQTLNWSNKQAVVLSAKKPKQLKENGKPLRSSNKYQPTVELC